MNDNFRVYKNDLMKDDEVEVHRARRMPLTNYEAANNNRRPFDQAD